MWTSYSEMLITQMYADFDKAKIEDCKEKLKEAVESHKKVRDEAPLFIYRLPGNLLNEREIELLREYTDRLADVSALMLGVESCLSRCINEWRKSQKLADDALRRHVAAFNNAAHDTGQYYVSPTAYPLNAISRFEGIL